MAYSCWHSIWHSLRHILWNSIRHSIWHLFWQIFWHSFWHSIWHLFRRSICHLFRHSFWRSFWHINLVSLLAFYLVYLRRFFVAQALRSSRLRSGRRGTLWSWACGGGTTGNTLIQRLLLGSDGEHSDLELAVEVRWGAEQGGRKEGRKEGGGGGQADIKSNYLLRVIPTKTFYLTHILTFYLAYVLTFFWKNFLAGKRRRGQLWWNLATFVGL